MKGLQSFQVVWDVEVAKPHRVIAVRKQGALRDRFELIVDNQLVLSETVGSFSLRGNRVILIDDEPIEVSWRWGRFRWSFIVGMILYALDGAVFMAFGEFVSVGFHLFALFGLYKGMTALKQLRALQESETL